MGTPHDAEEDKGGEQPAAPPAMAAEDAAEAVEQAQIAPIKVSSNRNRVTNDAAGEIQHMADGARAANAYDAEDAVGGVDAAASKDLAADGELREGPQPVEADGADLEAAQDGAHDWPNDFYGYVDGDGYREVVPNEDDDDDDEPGGIMGDPLLLGQIQIAEPAQAQNINDDAGGGDGAMGGVMIGGVGAAAGEDAAGPAAFPAMAAAEPDIFDNGAAQDGHEYGGFTYNGMYIKRLEVHLVRNDGAAPEANTDGAEAAVQPVG
ncbi:hypothetical protein GPECTOR_665g792 [Gonium pectorale]|uniref:Uncharacterized protein n=1 Tax=Gonium pectorale TaxID=33097 RepID=A0A150FVG9_GONPE|nr:hypothetical protein GPECTOR_665g792 [Gonium pectorale]|eukprot:KXZ41195.1 hypothetical protein GPECTOR_665g792 [Gonium pectorale]